MASYKDRLARLEAGFHCPLSPHHTPVVQIPWSEDPDTYLAQQPCPCGTQHCTEKRFGLVVSERGRQPIIDCDLHVILSRVEGRPDDLA